MTPTQASNRSIASIHPGGGKDPRTRRALSRTARWSVLMMLALLVVLGLGGLGWLMIRHVPARYSAFIVQQRQMTPQQKALVASELQDKVLGRLAEPRQKASAGASDPRGLTPSESAGMALPVMAERSVEGLAVKDLGQDQEGHWLRQVELGSDQINAWLTADFDQWLTYRDFAMPGQIREPMVQIHDGRTTLFFTFADETISQMFQADFQIDFDEDGQASLQLGHLQAGRLPLPVNLLGSVARKLAGQNLSARQAAGWMDKIAGARFKPAIKLPDGLKAQVMDYQVKHDKLVLTLRIERYRPSYLHLKEASMATADQSPGTTAGTGMSGVSGVAGR